MRAGIQRVEHTSHLMIDKTDTCQISVHGWLPLVVLDHPIMPRSQTAPRQLTGEVDDVVIVGGQNLRQQDFVWLANDVPPFAGGVQWNMREEESDRQEERFRLCLSQLLNSPGRDFKIALFFIARGELPPVPEFDSTRVADLVFRKGAVTASWSVLLKRFP